MASPSPELDPHDDKENLLLILVSVFGTASSILIFIGLFCCLKHLLQIYNNHSTTSRALNSPYIRQRYYHEDEQEYQGENPPNGEPRDQNQRVAQQDPHFNPIVPVQHDVYNQHALVTNPVFEDDVDSVGDVSNSHPDHGRFTHTVDNTIIRNMSPPARELMKVINRSIMKTVGSKLVVYITQEVGCDGGVLYLDNMGISLVVPNGAVPTGKTEIITLLLNWDLGDNPDMNQNQALVSPVVFVGPHGLRLNKPCILSYRHCAYDTRHIEVLKSETDLYGDKSWLPMSSTSGSEGFNFTPDECRLQINTFTLYTCIQRPLEGQTAKKWLQLAVFAEPLRHTVDHVQVRIYFLNKTTCALQWAIQNEKQFGARLICPEKLFLLDGTSNDVTTKLTYLSRGWTVVDDKKDDTLQFIHIWHGQCPHISVVFRRENPGIRELNFMTCVQQINRDNEMERLVVQTVEYDVNYRSSETSSGLPMIEYMPCRCIPQGLRTKLKFLMDTHSILGRNWKCLAEKLGYDGIIPYLDTKAESPTEVLLDVVENTNVPLERLMAIFTEIKRDDAARAIQEYMDTSPKSPRQPEENDLGATFYRPNVSYCPTD